MSDRKLKSEQNSPKSTRSMRGIEEKGAEGFLKAEDICKILVASKESGVSFLKFGHLEVRFGQEPAPLPATAPIQGPVPTMTGEDLGNITQAQQQAEEASLLEEEIRLKEDQLAEMALTDPLAYESLLTEGALEPVGDVNDGIAEEVVG